MTHIGRQWLGLQKFSPELGLGVALKLDDLVDFHKYQTLDFHQLKNDHEFPDRRVLGRLRKMTGSEPEVHRKCESIPACWTEEANIIEVNNNSI